jgi:hypothetical protein
MVALPFPTIKNNKNLQLQPLKSKSYIKPNAYSAKSMNLGVSRYPDFEYDRRRRWNRNWVWYKLQRSQMVS